MKQIFPTPQLTESLCPAGYFCGNGRPHLAEKVLGLLDLEHRNSLTTASLDAHLQNEAMKQYTVRRISKKLESSPLRPAVVIERTKKVIEVFSTARGKMIICMEMGDTTRCNLSLYQGQKVKALNKLSDALSSRKYTFDIF